VLLMNYMLTAGFVFSQQATVQVFWSFFAASFSIVRGKMIGGFALLGLVINLGVTVGLFAVVSLTSILAKLTRIGVAFVANFIMNLLLVFRPGREPELRPYFISPSLPISECRLITEGGLRPS
jgi:putative flippase GtrA